MALARLLVLLATYALPIAAGAALPGRVAAAASDGEGWSIRVPSDLIPASPRIARLARAVRSGRGEELGAFWKEIQENGAPLIEPLEGEGRKARDLPLAVPPDSTVAQGYSLVTFLWRSEQPVRVLLLDSGLAPNVFRLTLERLPGTDVWYRTLKARNDTRFAYEYSVNDSTYPYVHGESVAWPDGGHSDPLNPKRWDFLKPRVLSIAELPEAPTLTSSTVVDSVRHGEAGRFPDSLRSEVLGNRRRIFYYKPPGYSPAHAPYPLLIFAASYINMVPLPVIMDNLLAAGKIQPAVVVFIDYPPGAQSRETSCDPRFGEFLVKEFLPWVRKRVHVTRDPAHTIIGGASAGGLSAAFAAMEYPEVFGAVISQSGAFWRSTKFDPEEEWLARRFTAKPKLPIRFFLSCGSLENTDAFDTSISNVESNRHFRDVLRAKGYSVRYVEVMGAHDPFNWRVTLPDALVHFLGTPR